MYKKILIPTDGSPLAETAVDQGVALAKALGASVVVLTVVEPFEVMRHYNSDDENLRLDEVMERHDRGVAEHAKRMLAAAAAKAAAAGVEAATVHVQSNSAYEAIIRQAEENGADLIVMSSHGRRGVQALLIGSVTTKVLSHSKIPVHVLR